MVYNVKKEGAAPPFLLFFLRHRKYGGTLKFLTMTLFSIIKTNLCGYPLQPLLNLLCYFITKIKIVPILSRFAEVYKKLIVFYVSFHHLEKINCNDG